MVSNSLPSEEIGYFIPPEDAVFPGALGKYLHPLASNVLDAYLDAYTRPGEVALDPFAHTDALARAAARTGRKAVLSDLNPITSFVARTTLLAVTGRDLHLAYGRLVNSKQGEETLADHLRKLYVTVCPRCAAECAVDEYLWDRKRDELIGKRCVCSCGDGRATSEILPIAAADLEKVGSVEPRGFHYWYVVDRLAEGEEHREIATRLLDLYAPRTVYVLATLLRHIEGAGEGPNVEHWLKLALLECLCACSKLEGSDPLGRSGSEIDLKPPPRYLERNAWRWFGDAVERYRRQLEMRGADPSLPRLAANMERALAPSAYGKLGGSPNAIVLRQAARHLHRELPPASVSLVATSPPGPSHGTFLCLSYLWAGWLFGYEKARAWEQIPCSGRPMQWGDYYRAVVMALRGMWPALRPGAVILFAYRSDTIRQAEMLLLAGLAAGLRFRRLLCQPREPISGATSSGEPVALYRLEFHKPPGADASRDTVAAAGAGNVDPVLRQRVERSLHELLAQRAEPTGRLWLRMAVLDELARDGLLLSCLAEAEFDGPATAGKLAKEFDDALERRESKGAIGRMELGGALYWAAASLPPDAVPLSDRVEWAAYNLLSTGRVAGGTHLERIVNSLFPGLLTPEVGWVQECVASYAAQNNLGEWVLNPREELARRSEEHTAMVADLARLGRRFGFKVWIAREEQRRRHDGMPLGQLLSVAERFASPTSFLGSPKAAEVDVIWYQDGEAVCLFEVEWTAMLGAALVGRRLPTAARRYLVVADERAPLIAAKLKRCPWLQQVIDTDGWEFIKYRLLSAFVAAEDASQ